MDKTTITTSEALDIFAEDLQEIRDLLIQGLSEDIEELKKPEPIGDETEDWVRLEVYQLQFEKLTDFRLRMIKRITSYLDAKNNPRIGRITDEDIARAKEHPIQDFYAGKLRRSGDKLFGLCPFHNERTPSFCVKKNKYKCYSCGEYGDSIGFYMKMNGVNFISAVRKLI